MKKWKYIDPGPNGEVVETILTEEEILDQYFDHWSELMKKVGKEDQISKQNCIDDFVVVHWAWEVE